MIKNIKYQTLCVSRLTLEENAAAALYCTGQQGRISSDRTREDSVMERRYFYDNGINIYN